MLQKCYEAIVRAYVCACAFVRLYAPAFRVRTRVRELEAGSKLEAGTREGKLDHNFEGGIPMNSSLSANIRISDLPNYIKTGCFGRYVPELNCFWSEVRRSYPFVIAITGNIATAETFPYNRKEYRRTGDCFTFTRRANYRGGEFRGWHQLTFTFEILEKVATGEQVAIIRRVTRGGPVY